MYDLFGQDGLDLAINASIPNWFYEGDAVYNETILTNQGRGRLPLFINAYPSLWYAGKNYSWMKLRNGSLERLCTQSLLSRLPAGELWQGKIWN